jgi:glycosyltransferase involved in cell wall biosynthesis
MPAYQVEGQLTDTISRIPSSLWHEIECLWILDDGSTDQTAAIAQGLAKSNPRISVHSSSKNQGYSATVKKGLQLSLQGTSSIVVCLHADGQYAPECLPQLLEEMKAKELHLLQGSRHAKPGALQGGMPFYKWLAGKVLCALENRVFHLHLTDYHSGYILYHKEFLSQVPFMSLQGSFEFDLEMIASAKARNFRIGEYPIPTRYANEISHLNPIRYGVHVLAVLYRYLRGAYHG